MTGSRVQLRAPTRGDSKTFLSAVARSRRLHGRWVEPPRNTGEYEAFLRRQRRRSQRSYLVFTEEDALAGVININEIVRGAFCSGYLGYYAFHPHQGQGYMSEGLGQVIERAFSRLGLHRLEANVQPRNTASRRLVERLGFRLEGYSERYLKIAGRWCDHERWALTAEDWAARNTLTVFGKSRSRSAQETRSHENVRRGRRTR